MDKDSVKITAPDQIAEGATNYHDFMMKLGASEDIPLQDFCGEQFDTWEHNSVVNAQTAYETINEPSRRRICAGDNLVSEQGRRGGQRQRRRDRSNTTTATMRGDESHTM